MSGHISPKSSYYAIFAALSAIAYRVATDPRWNPNDDGYIESLWRWCRSKAAGSQRRT